MEYDLIVDRSTQNEDEGEDQASHGLVVKEKIRKCRYHDQSKDCESYGSNVDGDCESEAEETYTTTDGLWTAGALGDQLIGTGVQRLECRPVYQSWGSTLIFQCKIGVSWVQDLRHGVAIHPMGAAFEGRYDFAIYMGEPTLGRS